MSQTPSSIRAVLQRHDLQARKSLGQHFLADSNLIAKVVELAEVAAGDRILEVGAGTGALTNALSSTGAEVVAYEIDERLRPVLAETVTAANVDVRFGDAMEVDWRTTLTGGTWKLVANLPYNVGTPLVLDLLIAVPQVETIVVMVQREVADRLAATAGSSDYGLPSVVVGLTATVVDRFMVPAQVFVPPPRVESSVVRLDRLASVDPAIGGGLAVARRAFGQRRKMIRRSLAGMVTEDMFSRAGIASTARPEDLGPEAFVALGREVANG